MKSRKSLAFILPITVDFERFRKNLHSHFFFACLLFSQAVYAGQIHLTSAMALSICYSEDQDWFLVFLGSEFVTIKGTALSSRVR